MHTSFVEQTTKSILSQVAQESWSAFYSTIELRHGPTLHPQHFTQVTLILLSVSTMNIGYSFGKVKSLASANTDGLRTNQPNIIQGKAQNTSARQSFNSQKAQMAQLPNCEGTNKLKTGQKLSTQSSLLENSTIRASNSLGSRSCSCQWLSSPSGDKQVRG